MERLSYLPKVTQLQRLDNLNLNIPSSALLLLWHYSLGYSLHLEFCDKYKNMQVSYLFLERTHSRLQMPQGLAFHIPFL